MSEETLIRRVTDEGSICVGLNYRVAELGECEDPDCVCHENPHYLVAVKEAEEEWWGVAGFTEDPGKMVDNLAGDSEVMRVATSTILYGASWSMIEAKPLFVYQTQLWAVKHTPFRYWEIDLEALKGFRSMIQTHNPREVCALLNMTDKWAFDPGGTARGTPS